MSQQKKRGCQVSHQTIATAWGVSRQAVAKWVKLGLPITSVEEATKWRDAYLAKKGGGEQEPLTLTEARRQKTILEMERIRLKTQFESGKLVSKAEVIEDGVRIGTILSAKLDALVNDCSGILAGLNEAGVTACLRPRTQQLLSELKAYLEPDNTAEPHK